MSTAKTFFSYSRSDEAFALRLAQDLRQAGISIWFDQLDIAPGRRWDNEIQKALGTSDSLLVVLSPASVASENVMDEVSYALDQNKHVIPVMHLPTEAPLRIRRLQYIDFTTNYQAGLTNLLQVLRHANTESTGIVDVTPRPAAKITGVGISNSAAQSTASRPGSAKRKPLLYGAGAVVLALLIFLVFQMSSSAGKKSEGEEEAAANTTAGTEDVTEESTPKATYTLDQTEPVDKVVRDSVLTYMQDYLDPETNERLPTNLSYGLTHEDDCYQFFIAVRKGTVLPDGSEDIINRFSEHLNDKMFGEECLIVGAWDYAEGKWQYSKKFGSASPPTPGM